MLSLLTLTLLAIVPLLSYCTYLLRDISFSKRIQSHAIEQFCFDIWLDKTVNRTVRIVEEGGLIAEFKNPETPLEKQQLAENILQDALSFAGHDVKQFNFAALVKAKVNEIYHGK